MSALTAGDADKPPAGGTLEGAGARGAIPGTAACTSDRPRWAEVPLASAGLAPMNAARTKSTTAPISAPDIWVAKPAIAVPGSPWVTVDTMRSRVRSVRARGAVKLRAALTAPVGPAPAGPPCPSAPWHDAQDRAYSARPVSKEARVRGFMKVSIT